MLQQLSFYMTVTIMIWLLLAGVLMWSVVHFFPSLAPSKRASLIDSLGSKYQGAFALLIVLSLVLIVFGWRNTIPHQVYNPPSWGRHLTMLLMLVSVILLGAANGSSRIRQFVRHPMLRGVFVWGVAHLLANGDSRSVVLFGSMLIWSILSIRFINKRDGEWVKPVRPEGWAGDIKLLLISLAVYLGLMFLHPFFAGVPIVGR